MEEYEEDNGFEYEDKKKVDKDNDSLWRLFTIPEEIEFFLLKPNQLHFGQLAHHSQQRQCYRNLTGIHGLTK